MLPSHLPQISQAVSQDCLNPPILALGLMTVYRSFQSNFLVPSPIASTVSKSTACLGLFQTVSSLVCSWLWLPLLSLNNQHSLIFQKFYIFQKLVEISCLPTTPPISFIVLFLFSFFIHFSSQACASSAILNQNSLDNLMLILI